MVSTAKKTGPDRMRHYAALVAVSEQLGWPKKFRTDLTKHDKAFLSRPEFSAEEAFVWALYESGTHMMHVSLAQLLDAYDGPRIVLNTFPDAKLFGWDGAHLQPLADVEAAVRFMRLHACTCTPKKYSRQGKDHPHPCPASRL